MKKQAQPPSMKLEPIPEDQVPTHSRCCKAEITGRRLTIAHAFDFVLVGLCSKCRKHVARRNPRTHQYEWLNGLNYATADDAKL